MNPHNINRSVTSNELKELLENKARSYGIFNLSELADNYSTLSNNWIHPEWTVIYEGLLTMINKKEGWRYYDNDTKKWFVSKPLTRSDKLLAILFIELEGKNKGKYKFLQFFYKDNPVMKAQTIGRYKDT